MVVNEFNLASSEKQDTLQSSVNSKASQTSVNAIKTDTAYIRGQFPISVGTDVSKAVYKQFNYKESPTTTGTKTLLSVTGPGILSHYSLSGYARGTYGSINLNIIVDGVYLESEVTSTKSSDHSVLFGKSLKVTSVGDTTGQEVSAFLRYTML